MQSLFNFLAAGLLTIGPALAAQATPPPAADLTVVATRGQLFTLVLDGQPLTGGATQQVHVGWLAPGQHLADVRVYSPYGPPVGFRTTVWLQPGLDSRYVLAISPYGPRLESVGAVVPGSPGSYGGAYSRGGYGAPGPYGTVPGGSYGSAPGGAYGTPGGYGNAPGGAYGNAPGAYGTAPSTYPPTDPSYTGGYPAPGQPQGSYPPVAPGGGYGAPAPGSYAQPAPGPAPQGGYDPGQSGNANPDTMGGTLAPLSPTDTRDLTQELREQPTDEARLGVVRQALEGSSLQANELGELLRTLGTEPARVALAELGYTHLSDPANISQVYAQLRPSSVVKVQRELGL